MRARPLPPPAFSQFGHRLVCPIESPPAPRSWDVGLAILKHESYDAVPYPALGLKIAYIAAEATHGPPAQRALILKSKYQVTGHTQTHSINKAYRLYTNLGTWAS